MPHPLSFMREGLLLFKTTTAKWIARDPFRNSTVIAYYAIFALPGLLVIIINLTGYFLGETNITERIIQEIKTSIGPDTAQYVRRIVENTSDTQSLTISSLVSLGTLLFGATGVFFQVQKSLNFVWEVKPEPKRMWWKFIKDRLFSFGLVLSVGFLLLVSLVVSTILSSLSEWLSEHISASLTVVFRVLDLVVSLGAISLLFAAIFKFLPDAEVRWRDVWVGSVVTAVLFVTAKFLLSFYFGHSSPASTYGAAGSVVLIMLWVSYSSMILLFGAEFTRVFADRHGEKIVPSEFSRKAKDADLHT